ncbi:hypothetical protein SAMN06265795_12827 [Noviherbaspirillum humi]|uniref:Uncharacterized protein n=1 Tax=Noviherbaspirillum humi TaxID=1688639 RepID=A0A239M0Y8_9BURK|nr:hypothetical protein [Noviherbaspirillum humi]SNT35579.1 hypothetical protein SAMN06265795_12827 [Noviherbaspirillum humi]
MQIRPTDHLTEDLKTSTNLVRRPVDGIVLTSSGRAIPQPPWIFPDDPQSQADYDNWLLAQSREEAVLLDEALILARLDDLAAGGLDGTSRQLLSDFLFGILAPEFEARPLPEAGLPELLSDGVRLRW